MKSKESCSACLGVSKRSWQAEIIQDHLEEAAEMFEVLLTSPEGAVIGSVSKAQVTIRDSGRKYVPDLTGVSEIFISQ